MTNFSIEFFPPKIFNFNKKNFFLSKNFKKYLDIFYISVTFSSEIHNNKSNTISSSLNILNINNIIPHVSCLFDNKQDIRFILNKYKIYNINNIVILTGDLYLENFFNYANELINFIRCDTGNFFNIFIGAYPEKHFKSFCCKKDINFFINKVKSGADFVITQYFYSINNYFEFVDLVYKLGFKTPVIPGIMPIINYSQLINFSKKCETQIPIYIKNKLYKYYNDIISLRQIGIDITTNICKNLLEKNVPGLHFYTLNQYGIIKEIYDKLYI